MLWRTFGIAPVHELRDVGEAHVAVLQLGVRQHADAALARVLVAVEGEVHLLDAVPFRGGTERRLRATGGATEENAVFAVHREPLRRLFSPIERTRSNRGVA